MILSGQLRNLVKVSTFNGAKCLTLTDPTRHQALSLSMLRELTNSLEDVSEHRAVLIKSAGAKVFSAGHDLKELKTGTGLHEEIFTLCAKVKRESNPVLIVMRQIREVDVPVVAAVDGIAAAAGCQLVAACDIVLATERSKFSVPGVNLGIYCHSPGVELGRAIPKKVAMNMLTTGEYLTARDGFTLGLISKLVKDREALEDQVEHTLNAINATSRSVQSMGKASFYKQIEKDIATAAELMSDKMVENLTLADTQGGIDSFLNKQKPTWSHTDAKDE